MDSVWCTVEGSLGSLEERMYSVRPDSDKDDEQVFF